MAAACSIAPASSPTLVENSPIPATAELEQALNRVEYYQPLYGISGFENPLRQCRDRAQAIADELGPTVKNCRLVDFGSSLGYFPFFFADRGAIATGCDINPKNTAVALATQRLNCLPATFQTAALSLPTVRNICPGEFSVALMLSVLHHITHVQGIEYVAKMIKELLDRVPTLVMELAHRNENVAYAWRESLPEDPLAILADCGDVRVKSIGSFQSHLSVSVRPIYVVSR